MEVEPKRNEIFSNKDETAHGTRRNSLVERDVSAKFVSRTPPLKSHHLALRCDIAINKHCHVEQMTTCRYQRLLTFNIHYAVSYTYAGSYKNTTSVRLWCVYNFVVKIATWIKTDSGNTRLQSPIIKFHVILLYIFISSSYRSLSKRSNWQSDNDHL